MNSLAVLDKLKKIANFQKTSVKIVNDTKMTKTIVQEKFSNCLSILYDF